MPALRACAGHVVCGTKVGGIVEAVIAAFRALAKRAKQKRHVESSSSRPMKWLFYQEIID
jgi:hypothetical protein